MPSPVMLEAQLEEEVGVVGVVLLQHLGVLGKAAGCQAHSLTTEGVACAVVALSVEAHHTTAFVLDQSVTLVE